MSKSLAPDELVICIRSILDGHYTRVKDLEVQVVTVKLHVKTLSRKLDARNRTHAAMLARELHLI